MWHVTRLGESAFWQVDAWKEYEWLCHGFTTRDWGNLALHVDDEPELVVENRKELGLMLGFSVENWVTGNQVHQTRIAWVQAEHRGQGALEMSDALPDTDGMITDVPGILLATFYADCIPLLFVVPERKIVATAHAGWRGTCAEIAVQVIEKLGADFQVEPRQIQAAIGPGIGSCCYQVGENVASQFPEDVRIEREDGVYIDLAAANELQLQECGIDKNKIYTAEVCTNCNQQFYSYRREGIKAGRMAAVIGINRMQK